MKINIGEVLSKAWKIIWKFKVLWIFGILAGCGGGNSSRLNYNGGGGSSSGNQTGTGQLPEFFRRFENMQPERMFSEFLTQYTAIIVGTIMLLCILWIVFLFLGVMGKTGLIKGASKADGGAQSLGFGELWTESLPYFWRMLGLNVLVGLPFFILIVIVVAGLGFAGYSTFKDGMPGGGLMAVFVGMMGVFFGVICVVSIASIIIGMIVEQSQNALVLEDIGILESLGRGWAIFKSAVLTIIVIAIILGVLGSVAGLIMALPIIAVAIPGAIGVAAAGKDNFIIPLVIAGSCFVAYLPVLLVLSGILQAYNQSVWTLVFRRLAAPATVVADTVPSAQ